MQTLIKEIERLIISGRGGDAQKNLAQLCRLKIPRENLAKVASLTRRANLHELGIRMLHKYVYPTGKVARPATEAEKAEYAASLTFLGASEEALQILKKISSKEHPQILLYEAFAHFSEWNYTKAIPILYEYVRHPALDAYQKLVGKVNLTAALIPEKQFKEASDLVQEVMDMTKKKYPLIYGNTLELAAHINIFSGNFGLARKFLKNAGEIFVEQRGISHLFVKKWLCVLDLFQFPTRKESLIELRKLREEAKSVHIETVRDCDRFEVIVLKNYDLFLYLYFGTPHEGFRKHLLKDYDDHFNPPDFYDWQLGDFKKKATEPFDVTRGEGLGVQLKVGGLLHKMLSVITMDFYRPLRIAVAHQHLYPKEHFNPISSPKRIYEAARKLREFFKEASVPLDLTFVEGAHWLEATAPLSLRVTIQKRISDKSTLYFDEIKRTWPSGFFSATEAAKILKVSERSAQRVLKELCKDLRLRRVGTTKSSQYTVNVK